MEVKVSNYTEIYINLQKKILKKMLKFNLMSMMKLVEIKKNITKWNNCLDILSQEKLI